jgi:hypothetical protein
MAQFKLSPNVIDIWTAALRRYGLPKATEALTQIAINVRPGKGLPAIADVIEIISPKDVAKIADEDLAAVAASRIIGAVRKIGVSSDPDRNRRAREWVGELGWQVVENNGGWRFLCETLNTDDIPTVRAQFRREATALLAMSRRGDVTPPGLPGPGLNALPSMEQPKAIEAPAQHQPIPPDKIKSLRDSVTQPMPTPASP